MLLWNVRGKYYNFNQVLHLLILFKMSIKHLIILLIIKLYAQNKIYNEKVFNGKKSLKKNQKICKKKTILAGFIKRGKIFFNNLNPSYVTDNEFI